MLSENGWVNFWRVFLLILILVIWQWGDIVNNWLVADLEKSWRKALTIQVLEPFFKLELMQKRVKYQSRI